MYNVWDPNTTSIELYKHGGWQRLVIVTVSFVLRRFFSFFHEFGQKQNSVSKMSLNDDEMTMKQWENGPEKVKKMVKTVVTYKGYINGTLFD